MPLLRHKPRLHFAKLPRGKDGQPMFANHPQHAPVLHSLGEGGHVTLPAISLHQPFASAIALGLKTIETRGRMTWKSHTDIAIHASKSASYARAVFFDLIGEQFPDFRKAFQQADCLTFESLPFGEIVCVAELVEAVPVQFLSTLKDQSPLNYALGDFSPGRFGYMLRNIRPLKTPIPCKGHQGWFNVTIPTDSYASL